MNPDPWLQRWLPLVTERSEGRPVLELGCGSGGDTDFLVSNGHNVVALDLSEPAIAEARHRVPNARFHCCDLRDPFPVEPCSTGVIIASLSLHYFPWSETEMLVRRIQDTLFRGGVLLCRLNSTNDTHFGASGYPQIEEHYYSVDGQAKRFFDRHDIRRLFNRNWKILGLEERSTDKYDRPKSLWEVILENSPPDSPPIPHRPQA